MCKLLLVDDEDSTREGILEQIHWAQLGITQIMEAHDGLDAIRILASYEPDILLTDLRMPRMDGVALAAALSKTHPHIRIIFMSGYSDKEYLLSAIKLHVLSFVEKPISLPELQSVLIDAVDLCKRDKLSAEKELQHQTIKQKSIFYLRSELAFMLITPNVNLTELEHQMQITEHQIPTDSLFVCMLLEFNIHHERNTVLSNDIPLFKSTLDQICTKFRISAISAGKSNQVEVILFHTKVIDGHLLSKTRMEQYGNLLIEAISPDQMIGVAVGQPMRGLTNVHTSYETAVLAMQRIFICGTNRVVHYLESHTVPFEIPADLSSNFKDLLSKGSLEDVVFFVRKLTMDIRNHENSIPRMIREQYHLLAEICIKLAIDQTLAKSSKDIPSYEAIAFLNAPTLSVLERKLIETVQWLYKQREVAKEKGGIISKIIQHVQLNYQDSDLSISSIARSMYLAPTYLCTVFKAKNGITLNQYITDFRIEQSKVFLENATYSVAEVAEKVGFESSSYFCKVFRKVVGLTPSSYRDRYLP